MSFNNQAPSIPLYKNDGRGRDTYISLFNGGFSNYPYSKSYKRDFYEINYKINHPDLFKRRPIIKYISDGSGRDFFIQQNILSEHCKLKDSIDFPHILRSDSGVNEFRLTKRNTKSKFEKDLINRIFYGKCPGVKDRLMMPKVKFNYQKNKKKELKISLTNPNLKNEILNYEKNIKDLPELKNSISQSNFNSNNKISKSMNQKKGSQSMINIRAKNNDLINTIKSIYLFNQRKIKYNKCDLPIHF